MERELWQVGMDAIYLVNCGLHLQRPQRQIQCDLEQLYTFCEYHSITAVAAVALELLWREEPPAQPEQAGKFRQAMAANIRKNVLLNAEREQILQHLERIGCWYMPLKGSLLQYDYPKFGMRQMSDNDILIDPFRQEDVHEFLCQQGYKAVSYQATVENDYQKAPIYHFEMHVALFGVESPKVLRDYFSNVKERLIPDEGTAYGYHFTPEDFYLYFIAHGWKHAQRGGIGIRFLTDIWVYLQKHEKQLNWEHVDAELEKTGMAEFAHRCRQLSAKLFDSHVSIETFSEQEREMLEQFLTAGTRGTVERKICNQIKNSTGDHKKLRYVVSRVFPSAEVLSLVYPHITEQKWKVPLIWLWRLIRAILICPQDTVREIQILIKKN